MKVLSALQNYATVRERLTLIPADSIAGRALVTVIAIMTFLATLTGVPRCWCATPPAIGVRPPRVK